MTMVCNSLKMSASSIIPLAISVISRSRCTMAASLLPRRFCDVCCSVDWEYDLSVSDSIIDGSVYGFWDGVDARSRGEDMPPNVRSSAWGLSVFRVLQTARGLYFSDNCFASFGMPR